MSNRERPTARAHRELCEVIRPGDLVIDATAGNGHDTLFLALLVGDSGQVLAFDVQSSALDSTQQRLDQADLKNTRLILASHSELPAHAATASAAAVMFNLGYLPGGGHDLITREETTLPALEAAVRCLRPGGLLTIVCYPGHAGGDVESAAVLSWCGTLPPEWTAEIDRPAEAPVTSPFLILVRRV